MADEVVTVVDGPDKPALQRAVVYPERNVTFKTDTDTMDARIAEMVETGDGGFDFNLTGIFATGDLCGRRFRGTYSVESRSGSLMLGA